MMIDSDNPPRGARAEIKYDTFMSPVGLGVRRSHHPLVYDSPAMHGARRRLVEALDEQPGVLLASGFEYPGRYSRFDLGFVDPPLSLSGTEDGFVLRALNARGRVVLGACEAALRGASLCRELARSPERLSGRIAFDSGGGFFAEEQRTRQPSLIGVLRLLREAFAIPDPHLGFYGAFGYDLVRQFETLRCRADGGRDPRRPRLLQLYLPDRLLIIDHQRQTAAVIDYELEFGGATTEGLPRTTPAVALSVADEAREDEDTIADEFGPGEFEALVEAALARFRAGDLFEVTPSQRFLRRCRARPSQVFQQLEQDNPAPFAFLVHLGDDGHLVGASPEMFVRVAGRRVETCPIAGTIARGGDALGDAEQVLALLSSDKDAAELTMCTDVDRNDKARICEAGSVRVLGRRQIEMYSRLIHTVDHVEGQLRPELDALDALVSHGWAVTVTGAPKLDAMQFIEDHERSARGYYAGAVGVAGLDGSLNTGLTLRFVHMHDGLAEVRAGATLLHASDPASEAAECRLKASAMLTALKRAAGAAPAPIAARTPPAQRRAGRNRCVVIDHRDSFVHTLGDYFRQLGMAVTTVRAGLSMAQLDGLSPDLVVMSPGPGRPRDFDTAATLAHLAQRGLPMFGVCLGMQALVEFAGGQLSVLDTPRHGSASRLRVLDAGLFGRASGPLTVGRYHSLYTTVERLPSTLQALAQSADDDCVMACVHRELPFLGVQFHPESIMTGRDGFGLRLLDNALTTLLG